MNASTYTIQLEYGRQHVCPTIAQVILWLAGNARETGVLPTWLGWRNNADGSETCELQFNGQVVGFIHRA